MASWNVSAASIPTHTASWREERARGTPRRPGSGGQAQVGSPFLKGLSPCLLAARVPGTLGRGGHNRHRDRRGGNPSDGKVEIRIPTGTRDPGLWPWTIFFRHDLGGILLHRRRGGTPVRCRGGRTRGPSSGCTAGSTWSPCGGCGPCPGQGFAGRKGGVQLARGLVGLRSPGGATFSTEQSRWSRWYFLSCSTVHSV